MSLKEIEKAVNELTDVNKYDLIKNRFKPGTVFKFPVTNITNHNRSFQAHWLDTFNWLAYSPALDGAYCVPCVLFANLKENKGNLVLQPLTNWKKMPTKAEKHSSTKYNLDAVECAEAFCKTQEDPTIMITCRIEEKRVQNVEKNRKILKGIIRAVEFLGKQGLAFRGDNETIDGKGNPGNFLALMKLIGEKDETIGMHLKTPEMKNAKYISPQTQNEIISVVANDYIMKSLVEDIRKAKWYSIMADEACSHSKEILAVCVRFVDNNSNIREEFLAFSEVPQITGKYLAAEIKSIIQNRGLEMENIRGQSYDGASSMSSDITGVQKRVKEDAPKAMFVHCSNHCLNLVIEKSCNV